MPASRDITLDRVWMRRQTDRLIAFEVLSRAISGDNGPMGQAEMTERLGVGPDFFALMTLKLRRRHAAPVGDYTCETSEGIIIQ